MSIVSWAQTRAQVLLHGSLCPLPQSRSLRSDAGWMLLGPCCITLCSEEAAQLLFWKLSRGPCEDIQDGRASCVSGEHGYEILCGASGESIAASGFLHLAPPVRPCRVRVVTNTSTPKLARVSGRTLSTLSSFGVPVKMTSLSNSGAVQLCTQ